LQQAPAGFRDRVLVVDDFIDDLQDLPAQC
jgi:hypothetical protein